MSRLEHESSNKVHFERLYTSNRDGILAYLMCRVASPSDAADLLADTFLIAWRKIEDVPEGNGGRLWLYGVARRVLANHRRHEKVEGNLAKTLRNNLGLKIAEGKSKRDVPFDDVIEQALRRLSHSDREVIELSAWDQLTPTEIAQITGAKVGNVRVRLLRIRRVLSEHLIRAGYPDPNQLVP